LGVFSRQANFIKFMLTNQCARPWFVYAETFIPAFLELLITVTILDINDLIRNHGQKIVREGPNKTGRGGRHSPRIKSTGAGTKVDRYAQKGLKTLLIVTQPLENLGYAWLLYSALDDFFYDWQTLLEQAPYCTTDHLGGPLTRSRGPGFITILPGGFPIIMTDLDQNRASWVTTTISAIIPTATISALFAAQIGAPPGGITDVFIRLKVTDGFFTTTYESDKQDIPEGATKDFIVSTHFFIFSLGGASVSWELVGPAVPAGIFCGKARCIFYRSI